METEKFTIGHEGKFLGFETSLPEDVSSASRKVGIELVPVSGSHSYFLTVTPIERAVPMTVLITESILSVFISGIFFSAMSLTWAMVS